MNKLEEEKHKKIKKELMVQGKKEGYLCIEEFPIKGGYVDVVWLRKDYKHYFEVETSFFNLQIKKNIIKCLFERPDYLTIICCTEEAYEFVRDFKELFERYINTRIEVEKYEDYIKKMEVED